MEREMWVYGALADRIGPTMVAAELDVPFALWLTPTRNTMWGEAHGGPTLERLTLRARQLAGELAVLHGLGPPPFLEEPVQTTDSNARGALPTSPAQIMLALLCEKVSLPIAPPMSGGTFCQHGDLRLSNLLITDRRLWIIDFETISAGPAEADVAQVVAEVIAAAVRTGRDSFAAAEAFAHNLISTYEQVQTFQLDECQLAAATVYYLVASSLEYERGRELVATESLALIEMANRLHTRPEMYLSLEWTRS